MSADARTRSPRRRRRRGLLRRLWLVPLCVIAVAAIAYGVAELRSEQVTAESNLLVSSRPGAVGPGAAYEASRLALTYAALVGKDTGIVNQVAGDLRITPKRVRDSLTVSNPTDTAALRVRYRDEDPAVAAQGSRAAAQAIGGATPASPNIGPNTVQIVRLADTPDTPDDTVAALVIGGILGACLGIVLLVAWNRSDPRIDDPSDAEARTDLPASTLERLTPRAAGALVERWSRMSIERPTHVALIPVSSDVAAIAPDVAHRLREVGGAAEVTASGVPGTDGQAEADALDADVRVLLARCGVRERDLVAAVDALEQYDAPVSWTLFVERPKTALAGLGSPRALTRSTDEDGDRASAGAGATDR